MASIYHHRDFRSFIHAWMAEKKAGRSLRAVAKRMGKSAGGLSKIFAGDRHISEEIADLLLEQMKLGADEAAYFRILIDCEQAPSESERDEAELVRDAIFGFRNAHRLDAVQATYFSKWVHSAILALAGCRGFRSDPEWIAKTLIPPITPDEARKAVRYLVSVNLLVEEDGELKPPHAVVRTKAELDGGSVPEGLVIPDDPGAVERRKEAVRAWHRWMRGRAIESIDAFSREERILNSITLRVSETTLPVLVKRMEYLQAELIKVCEAEDEPGDTVYQLTLTLFPLSHRTTD